MKKGCHAAAKIAETAVPSLGTTVALNTVPSASFP